MQDYMDVKNIAHMYSEASDHVTLSIGIAEITPGTSSEEAIGLADKALYEAKVTRNCIKVNQ